jgi:nitrite reductase (NO-forming)
MRSLKLVIPAVIASAVALGGYVAVGSGGGNAVERVDFGQVVRPTSPTYLAAVSPASRAPIKEFRIPIKDAVVQIADGVKYEGWTFGGTVPGPVIHVRQGDLVRITLVNESPMPHSIDLHSARIPMSQAFRTIMPGQEIEFEFTAKDPGVFLVHCGTAPVLMHMMQGMYMPIIVDPEGGWGSKVDKEFVLVQSEFYTQPDSAHPDMPKPDYAAAQEKEPTYVVFNGRAGQYKADPLKVDVGDRVRFYVVDAGPNEDSDFHIVGTIFDRVYPDGNPDNRMEGVQTWHIPAGGGAVFETHFAKDGSGEGMYAFVTHSFADAEKGATGYIQVGSPKVVAGSMGH